MKKLITLLGLSVLLILAGCDNSTPSGAAPYENIPALSDYDAIFIGENHFNSANAMVQLDLIKYYYGQGLRDLAMEDAYLDILFLQYYLDTGNEECLEAIFRAKQGGNGCHHERYNFWKELCRWNLTLDEKITLHGFDADSGYYDCFLPAVWFFISQKYPGIQGIPGMTVGAGGSLWNWETLMYDAEDLVADFRTNKGRYASLSDEDMKTLEKIIASFEQLRALDTTMPPGREWNNWRERLMIDNFRGIMEETGGRKVLAIMGSRHSDLTGGTDTGPVDYSMASVLKDELNIASVVLREAPDPLRFQYHIRIDESKKTTPYVSTYNGNWPF